ncbi:MAG: hypothetical protein HY619_01555, partial [Thaumarchaeota archaeon]|nr:hypothetical protein [Nitrososphaerota archaeon]
MNRDLQFIYSQLSEIIKTEKDSGKAIGKTRPLLDEIITRRLVDEKFLRPLSHRPAAYLVHRPPDRSYSVISMVWGATQ